MNSADVAMAGDLLIYRMELPSSSTGNLFELQDLGTGEAVVVEMSYVHRLFSSKDHLLTLQVEGSETVISQVSRQGIVTAVGRLTGQPFHQELHQSVFGEMHTMRIGYHDYFLANSGKVIGSLNRQFDQTGIQFRPLIE